MRKNQLLRKVAFHMMQMDSYYRFMECMISSKIRSIISLFIGLCCCTIGLSAQAVVHDIEFVGNQHYPKLVLKEFIYSKSVNFWQRLLAKHELRNEFSQEEMLKDAVRLELFYQRRGFIDVHVQPDVEYVSDEKVKLLFQIQEGAALKVESFSLVYNTNDTSRSLIEADDRFQRALKKQNFREGKRYEPILSPEVKSTLLKPLKNLGFPFSSIKFDTSIDSLEKKVRIEAQINAGKRRRIGVFDVQGNTYSNKTTAIKESALKLGNWYEQRDVERAQRELFDHHMYRFATLSVKEGDTDSTVAIRFDIREQSLRSVELRGGVGVEQIVRGQVNWVHRNPFRKPHQFTTEASASFIEQRLSFSYLIPWVFNTQSSYVASPFIRNRIEPGFQLFSYGASNSLIYRANRDFTGTLTYTITTNQEQLPNLNIQLPDSVQSFDIASLNAGLLYTRGYVQDREGWVVRLNSELSGNLFVASYPFERFNVDIRHYKPAPWKGGQLAFKFESGILLSSRAINSLPRNIRFFLGGTSSVRGWNRQQLGPKEAIFDGDRFQELVPIGGRSMMALSVEFRQDLPFLIKGLGIAAFSDGGNIWADKFDFSQEGLRWGSGFGFRYASPIGPLRLDFGYKVNPTDLDRGIINGQQVANRSRWAVHFSLGQAF